ncbi:MAG: hypothetical protein JO040_02920, partial [Gemmatimonadetes bacterium]|nr:hypothetical protein [Gemmatimonadota bacterium]
VPTWLWPGLPYGALAFYLFGTITAVLSEHPIVSGIILLFTVTVIMLWNASGSATGGLVSSSATWPGWWRYAVAVLGLALLAATAVGAVALGVWRDRYGRLPTPGDARRSFREPVPTS